MTDVVPTTAAHAHPYDIATIAEARRALRHHTTEITDTTLRDLDYLVDTVDALALPLAEASDEAPERALIYTGQRLRDTVDEFKAWHHRLIALAVIVDDDDLDALNKHPGFKNVAPPRPPAPPVPVGSLADPADDPADQWKRATLRHFVEAEDGIIVGAAPMTVALYDLLTDEGGAALDEEAREALRAAVDRVRDCAFTVAQSAAARAREGDRP